MSSQALPPSLLVVEDNATDALLLEEALRELEFTGAMAVVVDAQEAVMRLQTGPLPDVLLMDMNMPRMTGVEVVRALAGQLAEVKVVVWSAAHNPLDAADAEAAGVQLYLEKPRTYDELLDVLSRIL